VLTVGSRSSSGTEPVTPTPSPAQSHTPPADNEDHRSTCGERYSLHSYVTRDHFGYLKNNGKIWRPGLRLKSTIGVYLPLLNCTFALVIKIIRICDVWSWQPWPLRIKVNGESKAFSCLVDCLVHVPKVSLNWPVTCRLYRGGTGMLCQGSRALRGAALRQLTAAIVHPLHRSREWVERAVS